MAQTLRLIGLERMASVITTARVVFPSQGLDASGDRLAITRSASASSRESGAVRQPARREPSSRRTSPKALTATAAATVGPPDPAIVRLAKPNPPFMPHVGPIALPTVAPTPAPTLPTAISPAAALARAASDRARVGRVSGSLR